MSRDLGYNRCACHVEAVYHRFGEELVCEVCKVTWKDFQTSPDPCLRVGRGKSGKAASSRPGYNDYPTKGGIDAESKRQKLPVHNGREGRRKEGSLETQDETSEQEQKSG